MSTVYSSREVLVLNMSRPPADLLHESTAIPVKLTRIAGANAKATLFKVIFQEFSSCCYYDLEQFFAAQDFADLAGDDYTSRRMLALWEALNKLIIIL